MNQIAKISSVPAHGSPTDRGSADAYYWRRPWPHKKVDGKHVELTDFDEIREYWNAYRDETDRKEW